MSEPSSLRIGLWVLALLYAVLWIYTTVVVRPVLTLCDGILTIILGIAFSLIVSFWLALGAVSSPGKGPKRTNRPPETGRILEPFSRGDSQFIVEEERRQTQWCRMVCWALFFVVLLVSAVFFGIVIYVKVATATTLSGSLIFAGLNQTVIVHRDPNGVAHIQALTDSDAFFAQGVVHAQERLWQMEFQKRVGRGTLAEALGDGALDIDKFTRTVGFYHAAEAALPALSEEGRALLQAYADGVNAFIDTKPPLSIEFILLGVKPSRWEIADSVAWGKLMAFQLALNLNQELLRYDLMGKGFNQTDLDVLVPLYDSSRFPVALDEEDIEHLPKKSVSAEKEEAEARAEKAAFEWGAQRARFFAATTSPAIGTVAKQWQAMTKVFRRYFGDSKASNNWVVGGAHTKSGKPLLCNDPHLQLTAPSIWYLVHLRGPTLDVIGASFPGVPGVVIGRNKNIAWGVTNVGADVQDLYVMEEPVNDSTVYKYRGEWVAYKMRQEVIKIKGQSDLVLKVKDSVNGPVVTGVNQISRTDVPESLALRWTALDANDATMESFIGIMRAATFGDFKNALRKYVGPSQNFIFADVQGNIGYQMPGLIPIRAEGHSGLYPVDGSGKYDWVSYIPYDELPWTLNPKKGYIVTANNKVVPDSYKYSIAKDWDSGAAGYRAYRITHMVQNPNVSRSDEGNNNMDNIVSNNNGLGVHDKQTMAAIQLDLHSSLVKDFQEWVIPRLLPKSSPGQAWQLRMMQWDGEMLVGSTEPTFFYVWYAQLAKVMYPLVGKTMEYWEEPLVLLRMFNTSGSGSDSKFCPAEGCLTYATNAWEATVKNETAVGRWGSEAAGLHMAQFTHLVLSGSPVGCLGERSIAHGGDESTVNVGGFSLGTFKQLNGPSYRHIVDLSDPESSLFLNPLGQSGDILSGRYDDFLSKWADGEYLEMRVDGFRGAKTQTLSPK